MFHWRRPQRLSSHSGGHTEVVAGPSLGTGLFWNSTNQSQCVSVTHTHFLPLPHSRRLANQLLLLLVAGLCRRSEGVCQRVCPTSMETRLLWPHPSVAPGTSQPVPVCQLKKVPRQKSSNPALPPFQRLQQLCGLI